MHDNLFKQTWKKIVATKVWSLEMAKIWTTPCVYLYFPCLKLNQFLIEVLRKFCIGIFLFLWYEGRVSNVF